MDLIKINDVIEYLKFLKVNLFDYIVVFASCDNIGREMSEETADLLIDLGLRDLHPYRALNGKFQLAYIAVVDSGNVCYERLGEDTDTVIKYRYQGINITSIKFNWKTPLYSQILYNGYDYSSGKRGISIFTLDKDTHKPIDTVLIDCTDRTAVFFRPFTVKDIAEYEKFRKEYQGISLPKLALTIPKYPYAETVVIKRKNTEINNQNTNILCAENNLNRFSICGVDCLTSSDLKMDPCGKRYIFSGVARYRDKFIIGYNDIDKHDIVIDNIRESVGCFSLAVFKDNNCIEFSVDYFGSQFLFYYKSDNITAVSTSYHLLLLTLKSYGEYLRLDEEKVIAAQSYFGAAFELGFTYEMDVAGVMELPPDKRLIIDDNGELIFQNTSLFYEEHNAEPYSEDRYNELLLQEKQEIIENCRAVFEHPEIDVVYSDLTGGMDSRLMLAAITNLEPKLQKKLRLSTAIRKDLSKDYEIANKIVAALSLKWDDSSRLFCINPDKNITGRIIESNYSSKLLGLNNEFMDTAFKIINPRSIHFVGGYGELVTKPNGYIYCPSDRNRESAIRFLCRNVDIQQSNVAYQYASKYIAHIIENADSFDNDTIFSYYYLHFLARHHWCFNSGYRLEWSPLMSKSGYHLKRMYTTVHKDSKLRFDLMAILNPLLASFEYDKESVNEEKKKLSNRLRMPINANVIVNSDNYEEFKDANKRRKQNFFPDKASVENADNNFKELYNSRESHLSALKAFLDYSAAFDKIGFQLFLFFNKDNGRQEYHSHFRYELNRINRLLQIYWQIKVISDK